MMLRINIIGFKGGSGKSTIAYYLAQQLSSHYSTALVDKTYSGTISRIFNINNNIFSFLRGKSELFYLIKGNLNIINMSFSGENNISNIDFDAFKYLYNKLLKDTDIVIVDHSSLPHDFATEIELKAFMENFRHFTYNTILVLSGDEFPIKRYLNYTSLLNEFVRHYVEDILGMTFSKDTKFLRVWAIVINKLLKGQESKLNEFLEGDEILLKSAKFVVPLYPSLLQRHFKEIDPPAEILKLIEYVESLIREPTSVL